MVPASECRQAGRGAGDARAAGTRRDGGRERRRGPNTDDRGWYAASAGSTMTPEDQAVVAAALPKVQHEFAVHCTPRERL